MQTFYRTVKLLKERFKEINENAALIEKPTQVNKSLKMDFKS